MTKQMTCVVCNKIIDEENEKYACVWGDSTNVMGFAHLACIDYFEDITGEVMGGNDTVRRE